jgi:hypothetical protein
MGWDVGETGEVAKAEGGLQVRILTEDGRVKSLFIPDPNLDPVRAVRRCHKYGKFEKGTT